MVEFTAWIAYRWGTHTKPSGEVYEGEWVDDVMEGKARVTFPDGAYFEGEFTNGLRVKVRSQSFPHERPWHLGMEPSSERSQRCGGFTRGEKESSERIARLLQNQRSHSLLRCVPQRAPSAACSVDTVAHVALWWIEWRCLKTLHQCPNIYTIPAEAVSLTHS